MRILGFLVKISISWPLVRFFEIKFPEIEKNFFGGTGNSEQKKSMRFFREL